MSPIHFEIGFKKTNMIGYLRMSEIEQYNGTKSSNEFNELVRDIESGNNETDSVSARRRVFAFTVNNYTEEIVAHLKSVQSTGGTGVSEIGWQEEIGKNGTPHLQGYIKMEKASYLKKINKEIFMNKAWLGAARDVKALKAYCCKEDTRIEGTSPVVLKPKSMIDNLLEIWYQEKWKDTYDTAVAEFLSEQVKKGIIKINGYSTCVKLAEGLRMAIHKDFTKMFLKENEEIENKEYESFRKAERTRRYRDMCGYSSSDEEDE